MSGFKRFLNIVFALLVLVSYVILILMAWPLSGFDTELPPYINTWFYIGVAAVVLLGIFVITRVVKSFMRPAGSRDLTEQKDGGTVQIAVEALRAIATKTALDQAYVNSAETEVRQAGKDAALDLKMSMKVQNEALENESVKDFAERIKARVSEAVSNFSGYPIHNFDIKVDVDDVQAPEHSSVAAPAPVAVSPQPEKVSAESNFAAAEAKIQEVGQPAQNLNEAKPLGELNNSLEPEKAELEKAIDQAQGQFADADRDIIIKR
ncbi:MAG: alkaline shock response membrane anchor protein AmaP [Eubacteriales bacterium]|nr:alkaline shock response membrane anchor protein AmaP [Eubacteriales bacterium]